MRQTVIRNAITSLAQTLINALCLFFTYRILLRSLGPVQLGVWSILTASSSFVRIGDLGFANGIVKCVARATISNDIGGIRNVMFTAAVLAIPLNTLLVLLGFPIVHWIIGYSVTDPMLRAMAYNLLPVSLTALWLQMLTAIPQATLDGTQRFDIRNALLSAGSVLQVIVTWLLVPRLGLIGAAYSQVILWAAVLIAIWTTVGIRVKLNLRNSRFRKVYIPELVSYGWNCQLMLICGITQDPVTKGLLAHFGGMRDVGYYELASRLINSLRTVVTAANQVMVPAVAQLSEAGGGSRLSTLYGMWFPSMMSISMTMYACAVASAPIISMLWIGSYSPEFVRIVCIVAVGGAVNAIGLPVYFFNLGTGILRWNTTAHVVIACLTPVFAFALGRVFGGYGVIVGATTAIAVGTGVMIFAQEPITANWGMVRKWAPTALVGAAVLFTLAADQQNSSARSISAVLIVAMIGLILGWQCSPLPEMVGVLRERAATRVPQLPLISSMLVSVVTPSFNQGLYLADCIDSVRNNGYPLVEHLIMDGGSTDNSLDVIRRNEKDLAYWTSGPDDGQADAINKGWALCRGDVFAFLNSDDYYVPNAISRAVEVFKQNPDVGVVYGQANVVDECGSIVSRTRVHVDGQAMLDGFVGLPQPATFVRRSVINSVGMLDSSFHFALDGEFFLRAVGNFKAISSDEVFACMRLHTAAKSVSAGAGFAPEVLRIAEKVLRSPEAYPRYTVRPSRVIAGAQVVSAKFYYMNGEWRKALPSLSRAFLGHPFYRRRILFGRVTAVARALPNWERPLSKV